MNPNIDPKVSLQNLLRGLFDRPIQMAVAPKFEVSFSKPGVIVVYTGTADDVVGLMVCSVAGAAYLGAALSLLPKPVAEDAIKKGTLDESLLENFREVANICTSLFAEQHGTRAHLQTVLNKVTAPPAAYKAILASPNRSDVSIELPNYGSGIISLRFPK
jgi:hypothetical protein